MMRITDLLKENKLKVTPQRLAIYDVLAKTTAHPSAERIHEMLSETHPSMSLATIYKTLDSFVKADLIQELNVGEDSFRYDANPKSHPHFKCTRCGRVYDLDKFDEQLDKQITNLYNDTGFTIERRLFFFFGCCNICNHQE